MRLNSPRQIATESKKPLQSVWCPCSNHKLSCARQMRPARPVFAPEYPYIRYSARLLSNVKSDTYRVKSKATQHPAATQSVLSLHVSSRYLSSLFLPRRLVSSALNFHFNLRFELTLLAYIFQFDFCDQQTMITSHIRGPFIPYVHSSHYPSLFAVF